LRAHFLEHFSAKRVLRFLQFQVELLDFQVQLIALVLPLDFRILEFALPLIRGFENCG